MRRHGYGHHVCRGRGPQPLFFVRVAPPPALVAHDGSVVRNVDRNLHFQPLAREGERPRIAAPKPRLLVDIHARIEHKRLFDRTPVVECAWRLLADIVLLVARPVEQVVDAFEGEIF